MIRLAAFQPQGPSQVGRRYFGVNAAPSGPSSLGGILIGWDIPRLFPTRPRWCDGNTTGTQKSRGAIPGTFWVENDLPVPQTMLCRIVPPTFPVVA